MNIHHLPGERSLGQDLRSGREILSHTQCFNYPSLRDRQEMEGVSGRWSYVDLDTEDG